MIVINGDKSINVTRGDAVVFSASFTIDGGEYIFKAGDVVRFKVFEKSNCANVVLQKDFDIAEESNAVEIFLDSNETKIGEVISKPKDYWYEIELNPSVKPQTAIGYDEEGPKIFRLYPEGADKEV